MRFHRRGKQKGIKGAREKLNYNERKEERNKERDPWQDLNKGQDSRVKTEPQKKKDQKETKKKRSWRSSIDKDKQKRSRLGVYLYIFLAASVVFFLVAVGAATYMFFSGGIFVSADNVDMEVERIDSDEPISAGDSVKLKIRVKNNNNVSLYNTNIVLRYPEGARDPSDTTSRKSSQRIKVGDLRAGGVKETETEFVMFGEEGGDYSFGANFEFTIEGSDAEFSKSKTFDLKLDRTPVSVDIEGPKEVFLNEDREYVIKVQSNADETQENILVKLDYPLNFYISELGQDMDKDSWLIESLAPGEEKEFTFTAMFTESSESEVNRTVNVSVGPQGDSFTEVNDSRVVVDIDDKPFETEVTLADDGQISFGYLEEGEFVWNNHSGADFEVARLEIALRNEALREFSAEGARERGDYLVWTDEDVNFSNSEGVIPFSFRTALREDQKERKLGFDISFEGETHQGKRVSFNKEGVFDFFTTFDVEVDSNLSSSSAISLRDYRESEKSDVTLRALVGIGDIEDAEVIAKFPSSLKIRDVSSDDEDVELNENNELRWRLGEVVAGTGIWDAGFSGPIQRKINLELNIDSEKDPDDVLIEEMMITGVDKELDEDIEKTIRDIPLDGRSPDLLEESTKRR